jgi:hypothetical protein
MLDSIVEPQRPVPTTKVGVLLKSAKSEFIVDPRLMLQLESRPARFGKGAGLLVWKIAPEGTRLPDGRGASGGPFFADEPSTCASFSYLDCGA